MKHKSLTLSAIALGLLVAAPAYAEYLIHKPILELLVVAPTAPIALTLPGSLAGQVGIGFSQSLASALTVNDANAGAPAWSATGLPAGMSLSPSGLLSGTPSMAGEYSVTITVVAGTHTVSKQTTIAVKPQLSLPDRTFTYEQGQAIVLDIAPQLTILGPGNIAVAPQWTFTSLPSFLTASSSTLSGTAGTPGTYAINAQASLMGASTTATISVVVNKAGLASFGSYKAWADGSYASSCLGYRQGDANHDYLGATGDGVYRISFEGSTLDVNCDMTNGGWTQVLNGPLNTNSTAFSGYPTATGNLRLPTVPSDYAGLVWKYADSTINALKSTAYRVQGYGAYNATRYFKASCTYAHTVVVSGACATSYSDEAFTSGQRVGIEGKGLSDNIGAGRYLVMVANHNGYESFGWCVGNGGSGGCGRAGDNTAIKVWVK